MHPWAAALVARFATYTEVSPSGTGVKLFCRGRWPGRRHRWGVPDESEGEIEVYDAARYFAVTGRVVGTVTAVADAQAALDELAAGGTGAKGVGPPVTATDKKDEAAQALGDDELLKKAMAAKNADKFEKLMDGDWGGLGYGSQSEADLALGTMLAFWCGKDAARMDRLFRRSKLMRPKWDDPRGDSTYGANTLATAIGGCAEVYTGGASPVAPPPADGGPADCPPDAIVGPTEAPDDPHRLGCRFRRSLSPDGEPPRLRHWLGDFWLWAHGVYRRMDDDDVRALLLIPSSIDP